MKKYKEHMDNLMSKSMKEGCATKKMKHGGMVKHHSLQHEDNIKYEKEKHWAEAHQRENHREFEKLKHDNPHFRHEMDGYKKGGCVKKHTSKHMTHDSYGMTGIPKGTRSMSHMQKKGNLSSVYY